MSESLPIWLELPDAEQPTVVSLQSNVGLKSPGLFGITVEELRFAIEGMPADAKLFFLSHDEPNDVVQEAATLKEREISRVSLLKGSVVVVPSARRVLYDGASLTMTQAEYELMQLLATNVNKMLPLNFIKDKLFLPEYNSVRSLNDRTYMLRGRFPIGVGKELISRERNYGLGILDETAKIAYA